MDSQYFTLDDAATLGLAAGDPVGFIRNLSGPVVKAGATVGAADFTALRGLRDQLGKRFRAGVMLYLGDQILPFSDKLSLVPVSALWAE